MIHINLATVFEDKEHVTMFKNRETMLVVYKMSEISCHILLTIVKDLLMKPLTKSFNNPPFLQCKTQKCTSVQYLCTSHPPLKHSKFSKAGKALAIIPRGVKYVARGQLSLGRRGNEDR